jgi:hypothetical protein
MSETPREVLVREADRLEFKAKNLRERGQMVMAAQEQVVAEAIRAVLAKEAQSAEHIQALLDRAQRSETECATLRAENATLVHQLNDSLRRSERDHIADADRVAQAEAERDALRAEVTKERAHAWRMTTSANAFLIERDALRVAVHEGRIRWTASLNRAERAEAALRRIAGQRLGEETWDDLLAVATGCIADARAALRGPAPAEVPLDSPDSVLPGVEALRARHYERINRVSQDAIKRARVGDTAPREGNPELRRVMGLGIPLDEQSEAGEGKP